MTHQERARRWLESHTHRSMAYYIDKVDPLAAEFSAVERETIERAVRIAASTKAVFLTGRNESPLESQLIGFKAAKERIRVALEGMREPNG